MTLQQRNNLIWNHVTSNLWPRHDLGSVTVITATNWLISPTYGHCHPEETAFLCWCPNFWQLQKAAMPPLYVSFPVSKRALCFVSPVLRCGSETCLWSCTLCLPSSLCCGWSTERPSPLTIWASPTDSWSPSSVRLQRVIVELHSSLWAADSLTLTLLITVSNLCPALWMWR